MRCRPSYICLCTISWQFCDRLPVVVGFMSKLCEHFRNMKYLWLFPQRECMPLQGTIISPCKFTWRICIMIAAICSNVRIYNRETNNLLNVADIFGKFYDMKVTILTVITSSISCFWIRPTVSGSGLSGLCNWLHMLNRCPLCSNFVLRQAGLSMQVLWQIIMQFVRFYQW